MQSFYMICCKKNNTNCFFSRGIHISSIPFDTYSDISLQKMTLYNKKQFSHDFYPTFCKFMKALKLYFKVCKSAKVFLQRELEGPTALPRFRKIFLEVSRIPP
jgi:hypothetical protein